MRYWKDGVVDEDQPVGSRSSCLSYVQQILAPELAAGDVVWLKKSRSKILSLKVMSALRELNGVFLLFPIWC
jgi:hypothetical protein